MSEIEREERLDTLSIMSDNAFQHTNHMIDEADQMERETRNNIVKTRKMMDRYIKETENIREEVDTLNKKLKYTIVGSVVVQVIVITSFLIHILF